MIRYGESGDWMGSLIGHKGAVWSARLNADATLAATGSADFTAKVWSALTGDELHSFMHKHIVKATAFTPDSTRLLSGGQEKKVRVFDMARTDAAPAILEGHSASILAVIGLTEPTAIVSAAQEKDLRLWDTRTGAVAKIIPTGAEVKGVSLSVDRTVLTAALSNATVNFYHANTLELIAELPLPFPTDCITYDPAHRRLVTGSGSDTDTWVRAYTVSPLSGGNSAAELVVVNKGHHGPARAVAFTSDGANYASGSVDGTIRIWAWNDYDKELNNE